MCRRLVMFVAVVIAATAALIPASAMGAGHSGPLLSGNLKVTGPVHFNGTVGQMIPNASVTGCERGPGVVDVSMWFGAKHPTSSAQITATFGLTIDRPGKAGGLARLQDGTFNLTHTRTQAQLSGPVGSVDLPGTSWRIVPATDQPW